MTTADMARAKGAMSFGRLSDGRETKLWRLVGADGLIVDASDYGGKVVRVYAPDRHGNLADVTLGWNTAAEYEKYGFSMGTLVGRYANRIKDGRFTLDGVEYQLPLNETSPKPRNCCLHGGPEGWQNQVWAARRFDEGEVSALELSYVSKDGEMGFPGEVKCKVTYRVKPGNVWTVDYEATTDRPTVINLTHHSYWNLAGEASGDVRKQELKIFADEYTAADAGLIPMETRSVKGTGFDFTEPRALDARAGWMAANAELRPTDNWYDHNFMLRDAEGGLHPAATLRDPASGRKLEVWTTEPCMQVYGAQNMDGTMPTKAAGGRLVQFAGLALETQHAPDSPNQPQLPSTVLRPGEIFRSRTEYRFSAE